MVATIVLPNPYGKNNKSLLLKLCLNTCHVLHHFAHWYQASLAGGQKALRSDLVNSTLTHSVDKPSAIPPSFFAYSTKRFKNLTKMCQLTDPFLHFVFHRTAVTDPLLLSRPRYPGSKKSSVIQQELKYTRPLLDLESIQNQSVFVLLRKCKPHFLQRRFALRIEKLLLCI